ncbi:hypothetical protein [Salipiger sp. PrR003]|uniref:hypothetical protein n=1 Tax=Salipiger sp. PrR003 TaxID=2706776 RepID=UPI0013DBF4BD|nr:hypothetical protein [Salipiger sp. PrR003]NDV50131.1 hypothetical protein [Salipiger sp. PrR003]
MSAPLEGGQRGLSVDTQATLAAAGAGDLASMAAKRTVTSAAGRAAAVGAKKATAGAQNYGQLATAGAQSLAHRVAV